MTAEQYKDFVRRIGSGEAEKLRAMATKLLNTEDPDETKKLLTGIKDRAERLMRIYGIERQ